MDIIKKKYCIDCKKLHTPKHTDWYNDNMSWCPVCFPDGRKTWEQVKAQ